MTGGSLPDALLFEAITRASSRLGNFGRPLHWYPEVSSTNDLAARFAEHGAAEGCLVVADAQTAGRGRLGRLWSSPAGAGIYASLVLRPAAHVSPFLTLAAGVAIAEGIQAATGLVAGVKWPNDIYVDSGSTSRKLAGILSEAGASPSGDSHVVVGFGINLLPAAYPSDVAARATSIEAELGRQVDRGLVLAECLASLRARYDELGSGRSAAVIEAWRVRAQATFGRAVEWDTPDGRGHGIAETVDDTGALIVRSDAVLTRIISGEVRWVQGG